MARREFPRAVKVAVIKRSTRDGAVYCEKCGALAKRWQIDHKPTRMVASRSSRTPN